MNRRLLLSLLGVALALAPPAAADRYEDVYEVDSDVHVDIEILQGRIEIEGWGKDEVRVRARGSGADGLDVEVEHDWGSIRAGGRGLGFFLGGELLLLVGDVLVVRAAAQGGVQIDDVAQENFALVQLIAPNDDGLECQRAFAQTGDHRFMPGFNALCDGDFAFA